MKKNKNKYTGLLFGTIFLKMGNNIMITEANIQVTAVANIIYEG